MKKKNTIFIASSTEALQYAEAVNIKLESIANIKQWDNAFDLSSITISSLIKKTKECDFAVFIFYNDDELMIRKESYTSVRDNVLFELGLFIGSLGLERCFILIPKQKEINFRIPTDLTAVTIATYDSENMDKLEAMTTCSAKIKFAIEKLTIPESLEENKSSEFSNLSLQIREYQSQIWTMKYDFDKINKDYLELLETTKNYFFSQIKPATEVEILNWENGAKKSYLDEVKIQRHKTYIVEKNLIVPSLFGSDMVNLIVKEGVEIIGHKFGHNQIYYMDGFRKL